MIKSDQIRLILGHCQPCKILPFPLTSWLTIQHPSPQGGSPYLQECWKWSELTFGNSSTQGQRIARMHKGSILKEDWIVHKQNCNSHLLELFTSQGVTSREANELVPGRNHLFLYSDMDQVLILIWNLFFLRKKKKRKDPTPCKMICYKKNKKKGGKWMNGWEKRMKSMILLPETQENKFLLSISLGISKKQVSSLDWFRYLTCKFTIFGLVIPTPCMWVLNACVWVLSPQSSHMQVVSLPRVFSPHVCESSQYSLLSREIYINHRFTQSNGEKRLGRYKTRPGAKSCRDKSEKRAARRILQIEQTLK